MNKSSRLWKFLFDLKAEQDEVSDIWAVRTNMQSDTFKAIANSMDVGFNVSIISQGAVLSEADSFDSHCMHLNEIKFKIVTWG